MRSKRFRLLSEQGKTEEPRNGIFDFGRVRIETRAKKMKEEEGEGKEDFLPFFHPSPLFYSRHFSRVSMGWWLLRLSAKILALLRLSVNFFQLRLKKS